MTDGDIWRHLRLLESIGDVVDHAEGPPIVLKDPNDDPIVYTALAGHADILRLSFCARYKIRIMTDVELLDFLRQLITAS